MIDKQKNKDQNKKKKPDIRQIKGRGRKPKVFKFNLLSLALIIGGSILAYLALSSFYSPSLGSKITFDDFVDRILSNTYSQVDVRDDGQAVGYDKYIDVSNNSENLDISVPEGTDLVREFETTTFDEFLEKVEPPQNVREAVEVLTRQREIFEVAEIVIADNFVIVKKANSDGGDLLIEDIEEEEFEQRIIDEKLSLEELAPSVSYLRSAARIRDIDSIKNVNESQKYSDVWVIEDMVMARLKDEEINKTYTLLAPLQNINLVDYLSTQGYEIDEGNIELNTVSIPIVPWSDILTVLLFLGFGGLVFMLFKGIQGSGSSLMQFGKSKAGVFFGRKPDITFKDVAGVDEAKEELKEVVMFLKSPGKFLKLGARIPKGLLLVGKPGTGKTLLAKAIAGEAGVPFFHTSGSEFEEMLVGAGASRVRDLFEKAKKASPALIFIDEIDAVARKRGTTVQSSSTEQTLNQILVEMDGFEKNVNVIVIAATNRPDVLDPAILRPGRFDRRVVLDLPDIEGRKAIVKIHSKNKPLADDVDIATVAKRTVGFSGADIENMLNEAAIITAKDDRKEITAEDIEEAATKVSIGPEKRRKRQEEELKLTAYHEVGHAMIAKLTPKSDPVHRITIISRGMSLGSTMQLPQNDKVQQSKVELESRIKVLLGGRAAEELIFNDITGGASSDIDKATSIARNMVKILGMSKKLGLVKYGQSNELQYLGYGYGEQRDYSEKTAELIDEEVRAIIQDAYKEVLEILKDKEELLHQISKDLLDQETMEGEDFDKYFEEGEVKKEEGDEGKDSKE